MRATLVEVLGVAVGGGMYTLDWLEARVRWHLDPDQCTGEVFLATDTEGGITGHTIVRVEQEIHGTSIGLFSTTYVVPAARHTGVAKALIDRGEAWLRDRGQTSAATYTAPTNTKLVNLFGGRGYAIVDRREGFIKLVKALAH